MTPLKLLIEQPTYDLDVVHEEKNKNEPRELFIKGPYLMAEKKNKNGRVYSLNEMAAEVNRYTKDMIQSKRSIGELNHPTSVEVNPERACHLITNLKQDNNLFIGESKILSNPIGQCVRSLLMDGVRLGISSRALGKLNEQNGVNQVSEFHLITADIVHDPSVQDAYVSAVLESKEWILKCDGSICEWVQAEHEKLEKNCSKLPSHDKEKFLLEQVLSFINSLKMM